MVSGRAYSSQLLSALFLRTLFEDESVALDGDTVSDEG